MRRRERKRLARSLALLAACICLPIWIVKGCIIATQNSDSSDEEESSSGGVFSPGPTVEVNDGGEGFSLPLEEYLVGVVAAEMPASYHAEALKAQAVAARTYTCRKLQNGGCKHGGDICTDSGCCQAYTPPEELSETKRAAIEAAVYGTAGEVAVYGGEPIEAVFHSTAGGYTEDSENAFVTALPYLRSVKSDETDAPRYASAQTMTNSEFCARVQSAFGVRLSDPARETAVLSRYASGRVESLRLGGTTVTGKEFRSAFSLDSTNFSFEFGNGAVTISTKGFGHGVGLSQTGAQMMAEEGSDYREILSYYYTGISLEKYW